VAGCPPDYFCATGQLWGNPLYSWNHLRRNAYQWWIRRLEHSYYMYDVLRIDHFRGFDAYYSIPFGRETAEEGQWKKGPGLRFFQYMKKALGDRPIIAEDLGALTDSVRELVNKAGYPGMKVLQFAFTPGEKSEYLPHLYPENCVVYTGTHDNDTTKGWYRTLSLEEKEMVRDYLGREELTEETVSWDLIMLAQRSVADLCIIPLQDYLNLGSEARTNLPGTVYGNWSWRMDKDALTPKLIERIRRVTKLCDRI
jgi:4-alpha-glucanotransferase